MDPGSLIVLSGLTMTGLGFALRMFRTSRDTLTRRAFRLPVVKIGNVRNKSIVVVVGTVTHTESISSQLTHRPCAAFEYVEASKLNEVWHERVRRIAGVDFAVTDESGEALVHGADVEMLLMKDERSAWGNANWERREGTIANGDQIAVVGYASREPDPRPQSAGLGYRERPTVLVLRSTRRNRARITNSPAVLSRASPPQATAAP
jgi:hypothetical protein